MPKRDNSISIHDRHATRDRRRARALDELTRAWRDRRIWQALALSDIRAKYRLSVIGSFWISISTGFTALTIGLIYGQFFGADMRQYLPYFTAGIIFWTWINMSLNEASAILVNSSSLIKASNLPIIFYILRSVQRNLIIAAHNLIILCAIWLWFRWPLASFAFLSIAGAILVYFFLIGASIVVAFVCVRYRDAQPIVAAATQFLFFATPIMWYPEQMRVGSFILTFNPFAYVFIVVRDPVLGRPVPLETWLIASLIVFVTLALASAIYVRYRDRIAYWI